MWNALIEAEQGAMSILSLLNCRVWGPWIGKMDAAFHSVLPRLAKLSDPWPQSVL
jgi:hypothetical protein